MHPAGTGPEDENVMPARSVAKLAYHLLKDYPEVLETAKHSEKNIPRRYIDDAIKMDNWNFMLPGLVYRISRRRWIENRYNRFCGTLFYRNC